MRAISGAIRVVRAYVWILVSTLRLLAWQLLGSRSFERSERPPFLPTLRQVLVAGKSVLFDRRWYLRRYPDVAAGGLDPLVHYLVRGGTAGYDPHPLFDSSWYLERNADVAMAGINPLVHYLEHGGSEGRDPHPLFDTRYFLNNASSARRSG